MLDQIAAQLADYEVVLRPERDEAEWWAGAPAVCVDSDGTVWLVARMRSPERPKGERGYALWLLRSGDGIRFEKVRVWPREEAGVNGFERAALVRDPSTGKYRLFCCNDPGSGWQILACAEADSPEAIDIATARPVIALEKPEADTFGVTGVKDPVVWIEDGRWQMFVIGLDRVERIHHFVSADGDRWETGLPSPVLPNTGWHDLYTRPASVLPLTVGYLFVYEGSHHRWFDPNYNIATGLAYSPDLRVFHDLTPDAPLLETTTPGKYRTWRYSQWARHGGVVKVYFEAACANGTNELRVAVLPDVLRLAPG